MRAETGLTQYIFPWDDQYKEMQAKAGKKEDESIYTEEMIRDMCLDPSMAAKPGCYGACHCHHRQD